MSATTDKRRSPSFSSDLAAHRKSELRLAIKVAKWGNCLAVRIPKEKAIETGLSAGVTVFVEVTKNGILLRPIRLRPTLKELVAAIKPTNRHREADLGVPVGKEVV